jgi:hypothetical protein
VVLIPAGWRTSDSGHTVFLTVSRAAAPADGAAAPADDVRDVAVSNSGPGLPYHVADHATQKYQCTMVLRGVPAWKLTDEWVLYLLLQNFCVPKDTNGPQVLYEVVLPHLAGKTLHEAWADAGETRCTMCAAVGVLTRAHAMLS